MERAVESALEGKCIVYPTSTQPALGCIPNSDSLDMLFELKKRDVDQPVSLGVADIGQAEDLVEVPKIANEILDYFPKGSLTLLLEAKEVLDQRLGGNMVAVRVMSHPSAIKLLENTGPLTATSANVSGEEPVEDCEIDSIWIHNSDTWSVSSITDSAGVLSFEYEEYNNAWFSGDCPDDSGTVTFTLEKADGGEREGSRRVAACPLCCYGTCRDRSIGLEL